MLKEIGLKDFDFNIEWYEYEKLIVAYVNVRNHCKIKVLDATMDFHKGDKLIVGRSKRYTEEEISKIATLSGMRIVDFTVSKNNLVSVLVSAPRRWS